MRHLTPNDPRLPEKARSVGLLNPSGARSAQTDPRAEAVLASLLESVECGILLFSVGGDLWAVNDRFAEFVGIEPERLRELSNLEQIVERVAPQFVQAESVAARWRQGFRSGEAFRDELALAKPEKKIVERYARPVLDRYKQPLGWLEMYRDITGPRAIESRLFHSERLAALGQMVSGITHELNNALTSVLGYAQLIQKRTRGFAWEAEARHILDEGERARRIAQNLLLFARGSKGERAPVNLNEIVERTVEIRGYELRLENIHVDLELDDQLRDAIVDAGQIQQALLNLIVNAEQAILQAKNGGRIWIRTKQTSAERVTVEIADDGPGVPPEVVLRIFDPFFTTKPAGVGTGLGLSILCGIVRQHGGEVSVESRPGGGAVFAVELPCGATTAAAGEKPYVIRTAGPEPRFGSEKGRSRRVLVVEDEPTVAQLISDVLSEEGHWVGTVLDSREGLDLARARPYDLLICDLRMPHLDGREFFRQLARAESPIRHRLIFVTGDTLAPRTVDFLQQCGLPYLAKPFLVEELKDVVARTLASNPGMADSANGVEREAPRSGQDSRRRHWKQYGA
jgi:signal transduction histidine kinase/CheY-like chemotaxis protein